MGIKPIKTERRKPFALKHIDDEPMSKSNINRTTRHTMSQGPGVLLGNMTGYCDEASFIQELTNSNSAVNLV